MELLANTTFWVGVAFAGFIFLVVYFKAHKTVGTMLDERAATIEAQIEEAKNLRAEAENLLIEYQRKQRDAEREAGGKPQDRTTHPFRARREAARPLRPRQQTPWFELARRGRTAEQVIPW